MGKKAKAAAIPPPKRSYLKQADVPGTTLEEALRVPMAILDHYAGKPTSPLHLAKALNVDPGGSQLRILTGASIAYGLTDGGGQASTITVLDLARNILRPTSEGADLVARREAVLRPRVFGDFLRQYNGYSFPRPDIAVNVLEGMGVPREKAPEVLERIEASAQEVGFLIEIKGKRHVSLEDSGAAVTRTDPSEPSNEASTETPEKPEYQAPPPLPPPAAKQSPALGNAIVEDLRRRRVFITHGKNAQVVDPIKKLLEFGELEPVVSVEKQTVSKPVPEKVMDDMRSCGAAIIHVDADVTVVDKDGKDHVFLNPNVLIEIGAAMAFYGRRFILLVRDGLKLPSNLQGLYEVRYTGDTLDAESAIKLLDAIKDIKNYALPTDKKESDVA